MWQLEIAATYASSGSTLASFDHGFGTLCGDGDAGTVRPPSNVHVCSREYLPLRNSSLVRFQRMTAVCEDMVMRLSPLRGYERGRGQDRYANAAPQIPNHP